MGSTSFERWGGPVARHPRSGCPAHAVADPESDRERRSVALAATYRWLREQSTPGRDSEVRAPWTTHGRSTVALPRISWPI